MQCNSQIGCLIVEAEFVRGVIQSEDVFGRDADLDVVDTIEDVAATGFEGLDVLFDVLADFGRFGERQDVLGIDCAAPEGKPLAVFGLEVFGVHIVCANLDGI